MTRSASTPVVSLIASLLLAAAVTGFLYAQTPAANPANAAAPANIETTNASLGTIPALQGVYYRYQDRWVALPFTILSPYPKSSWKWWLSIGDREFRAEVPGEHAAHDVTQMPVFVIRGLASRLTPLMVRFQEKDEFRSIRMPLGNLHEPHTTFAEDTRIPIDVRQVSDTMVAVRPRQALTPGEYAVVASPNANATMEFFSYDFRVAP